jgi:acyl-CoA thioesterase I
MKKLFIFGVLILLFSASFVNRKIKVVCVGDSITEGSGLKVQSKTAYPAVLNNILGSEYAVLNSGRSSTTMQKTGDVPYWNCKEFTNTFVYQPDIIIIKLGTNDTKPRNWHADRYEKDYQALIDTFKTMPSNPKIYLCLPVPAFKTKWGINDSAITNGVIPIIKKIAKTNKLPVIDLHSKMKDQGANFPDSIHPNEKAAQVMAKIIADEIKK